MYTVGHILFNLALLVIFFDEKEWKWCGVTIFASNFIDLDNFYSYHKDDGDASALDIHYLHGQAQLNLILFFSCSFLLISHKQKSSAEAPILAFVVGLVFHIVGDWWSWCWGYNVYGALIEIAVFVMTTLYRARTSMYRFYVFLFVGHVCTIFTLGFIVYMILLADDISSTEYIWPTIVDNCLRLIMVLPWFFLIRVAEVEVQAVEVERRSHSSKNGRRRDPMHRVNSQDHSEEFDIDNPPRQSRAEGMNPKTSTTIIIGEDSEEEEQDNDDSSSSSSGDEESQKSPVITKVCEALRESANQTSATIENLEKETLNRSSKSSDKIISLKNGDEENGLKDATLPRQSIKDPTKIKSKLLAFDKRTSGLARPSRFIGEAFE